MLRHLPDGYPRLRLVAKKQYANRHSPTLNLHHLVTGRQIPLPTAGWTAILGVNFQVDGVLLERNRLIVLPTA